MLTMRHTNKINIKDFPLSRTHSFKLFLSTHNSCTYMPTLLALDFTLSDYLPIILVLVSPNVIVCNVIYGCLYHF